MHHNEVIDELFDKGWYESETGLVFETAKKALQHYLSVGEKKGVFPNPVFDPIYYIDEYSLSAEKSALRDFCDIGQIENRNPNAWFLSEWYKWQNPDSAAFSHPILHFLSIGSTEFRDPSPWVDMVLVKRMAENNLSGTLLLNKIIISELKNDNGVCNSLTDLVGKQKYFIDNISFNAKKIQPTTSGKKYLLWVQCKAGAEFFNWYKDADRNWDLLLNYYSGDEVPNLGEYIVAQNGTKFTAIFNVWRYTNIFEHYEYVLFIDDDLIFKYKSINEYFEYVEKNSLDLSQPSLSKGSYCAWPVFFNKESDTGYRKTNGVEIMMPGMSKNALSKLAPYFSLSVSGFGLDLLFAKLAKDEKYKVGVVDQVQVDHHSAIDQSEGAYYELLRKNGLNSRCELWFLLQNYNLEQNFYECK